MSKFKIEISSVPDRENLVAEIWYGEFLVAEINQEQENLRIQLYQSNKMQFDLNDLLKTLISAKNELCPI
ncbi:MAG: hypothetical protein IPP04_07045 [Saprospiraceae bacterium]|nr:hypothetical protein [Saprospiraceae bacterium]